MPTNSPEAYDYYLKARFLFNKANDEQRVDINMEGACLFYPERRFEEACRELLVSIRLNPNLSIAHQWYAQLLMITGPIEEARVYMDRVLELKPISGWPII